MRVASVLVLFSLLALHAIPVVATAQSNTDKVAPAVSEPEMVLIPGAQFPMGKEGFGDHSPRHQVRVNPFYIDKYEVTNSSYQAFCEDTDHRFPEFWGMDVYRSGPDYPDHPVVGVSWHDAQDYAKWRGARLPTEAEWEYAARGGLVDKNYSHGDDFDSTMYAPGGFTGKGGPSRVGSLPPNGYGLHDMTRNVLEWVIDWYDPEYYSVTTASNPTGPGYGKFRGVRGGGWHTGPYCSRVYIRTGLQSNWLDFNVGFRCAKYVGESAALKMETAIEEEGIESGLALYREMRGIEPGAYYFDEGEFNEMGYRLLGKGKTDEAIEVFRIGVEAYPQSYNAFDSLGEAYRKRGDTAAAIENYRKALELNPASRTSRKALEELEAP